MRDIETLCGYVADAIMRLMRQDEISWREAVELLSYLNVEYPDGIRRAHNVDPDKLPLVPRGDAGQKIAQPMCEFIGTLREIEIMCGDNDDSPRISINMSVEAAHADLALVIKRISDEAKRREK